MGPSGSLILGTQVAPISLPSWPKDGSGVCACVRVYVCVCACVFSCSSQLESTLTFYSVKTIYK